MMKVLADYNSISEQAAAWVAAMDRGLSADEKRDLEWWLASSHRHAEALVQMAAMWDMLDVLEPIADLLPIDLVLEKSQNTKLTKGNSTRLWPIAASLILASLTLVFAYQWHESRSANESAVVKTDAAEQRVTIPEKANSEQGEKVFYTTTFGQRSDISLPDGSEVKLNTNTQLRVVFSPELRQIQLEQGEAYFDVVSDPSRPFVVVTREGRVTAIGTSFGVNVSHLGRTDVLVTEGRVKVDRLGAEDQVKPAIDDSVVLSRRQRAQVKKENTEVSSDVDLDQALAWREGRLIFSGESLEYVIAEIDRYTPLQLELVDASIADIPVGGFFKTGDLNQLLDVLEHNFGVRSRRVGDRLLFSKRDSES